MKNFLIFASGCAVGVLGTLIYLRKEIKKKLAQEASARVSEQSEESDKDLSNDSEEKNSENDKNSHYEVFDKGQLPITKVTNNKMDTTKIRYDSLVRAETRGEMPENNIVVEEDNNEDFYVELKNHPRFEPIHDMSEWDDSMFNKERYVYFKADSILCTEDGSIIRDPELMVGNEWQKYVGAFGHMPHTSLIRDNKRIMNLEIFVEEGLYSDEYGDFDQGLDEG